MSFGETVEHEHQLTVYRSGGRCVERELPDLQLDSLHRRLARGHGLDQCLPVRFFGFVLTQARHKCEHGQNGDRPHRSHGYLRVVVTPTSGVQLTALAEDGGPLLTRAYLGWATSATIGGPIVV